MFSQDVKNTAFNHVKASIEAAKPTKEKILSILSKASRLERITKEELLLMLNADSMAFTDHIRETAYNVTLQRHGKVIRFYAPVYVSNECTNKCAYCGFNSSNVINRTTLTIDEVLAEAKIIKSMGIDNLLVVAGESLKSVGLDYLKSISSLLSKTFSSVTVEVAPLKTEEYKQLFDSGIDGVTCYQETYDPEKYAKFHLAGPKTDMDNRLDTLDRAGLAKMRSLGVGTLLGLSDFKTEAFFTTLHARYLEKKYWQSSVSVSFPRIRPSEGGFQPPCPVEDEELLHVISVLRVFLPDSNLVLSTRESSAFRDKAIFYGVNQISAGSRTNPLGYSHDDGTGKQFEISDDRSPGEIAKKLSQYGYDPVFKDWDTGFRYE